MEGLALAAVAALILAYAAFSRRLSASVVTPPMVFAVGGILLSDEVLGWIEVPLTGETVRLVAEATLTLVLFGDASRIDVRSLRREFVLPLRLLAIGLPLTIVAGALAGWGIIAELTFIEAVILAIVLAPTDAALGQAVVTNKRVPLRVRQGLNVESGLNDGICVPLLLIALAVLEADEGAIGGGEAVKLVFEEIGYGILGGVVAGVAAAAIIRFSGARRWIDGQWLQLVPVAGALLAYGLATWWGGSGFIAAFVGGLIFGRLRSEDSEEATVFLEDTGGFLGAVTFVLFGAVMLAPALTDLTWEPIVYAVLSLTLVRMIPVALALIRTGARRPTVAFLGWFGPRGLASIVFAVLILDSELPNQGIVQTTIFVTIALSVLAHGVTAAPLAGRYGRWFESHPEDAKPELESGVAPHDRVHRWRRGSGETTSGPVSGGETAP
jgi:NhaP-type Na+/H+ or K+/H+ antiporter